MYRISFKIKFFKKTFGYFDKGLYAMMTNKFKKLFENFETDVLNFKINIIEKIEDGDAGDRLKQFGGLIGIYYYIPK